MFELTYRCNFNCRHCYIPQSYRKYGELTTSGVLSVLEQLKEAGCFYLGFTGGEPFIREDIMDILRYSKRLGFQIIINTNGSLIDEVKARELAILRPNKVDITIPAITREAFDSISKVAGYFDKVFRGINLLQEKRINLGFKSCVLEENKYQIKEIQDFTRSLGALYRLDSMLWPCLDGSTQPYQYRGRLFDNANLRKSKTNSREFTKANLCEGFNDKISVNSRAISEDSRLFNCGAGQTQAAITPLGELKMCLMIDYPKYKIKTQNQKPKTKNQRLQEMSLKEAWQKLRKLVISIKPDENYKCVDCELRAYCKWCPARAWLYNGTFTSCEPQSRAWAENRRSQFYPHSHILPKVRG